MAGVWPNMDLSDLTARSRTYLNEAVAKFYPDAELYRNLSLGAKKVAQEGSAVRRIIDAVTSTSTRTVATTCYKVMFVEYIPATGRSMMLRKIEPHQVGLKALKGTAPQYWYEFGNTIGIDPLPDAVYNLRLYVSDVPRINNSTFPIQNYSTGWTTAAAGGSSFSLMGGVMLRYNGAAGGSGSATWNTALTIGASYWIQVTVYFASGSGGTITPVLGGNTFPNITTSDPVYLSSLKKYIFTATTADLVFNFTSTATVDARLWTLYLAKEADFYAVTDQTDIPPMWQHLISLIATSEGLKRDNRNGPAQILEALTAGKIAYLRSNILEIIPTSRNERRAD